MLPKIPKRPNLFPRIIGSLIIFESLAFGGAYIVWHQLNKSQEFREKAKHSAPWVLETYYKMGELMSDKNKIIRQTDEKRWAQAQAVKSKTETD